MNENIKLCYENAKEDGTGSTIVSPCLKLKGHEGLHEHKRLCSNIGCMCGNFNKYITGDERYQLEVAKNKIREFFKIEDNIIKKVKDRIEEDISKHNMRKEKR